MSDSSHLITRREALKRGAIVGGAVLWTVPVVQTLGMGRAFASIPSQVCTPGWADELLKPVGYWPGTTKVGGTISTDRDDPSAALLAPDNNFVSLGYGGVLIVRLSARYYAGNSGSALVVETTRGAPDYPLEKAAISVAESSSGIYYPIGVATNKQPGDPERTEIDLDSAINPPPNFLWVKLVDITDDPDHIDSADGFDVDAVGISCP